MICYDDSDDIVYERSYCVDELDFNIQNRIEIDIRYRLVEYSLDWILDPIHVFKKY